MKKILIWGTGTKFAMYYRWLIENFEVQAFITRDEEFSARFSYAEGIPTITKERIQDFDRDVIVIAAGQPGEAEIREDAKVLGLPEKELISLESFIQEEGLEGSYEEGVVSRQLKVIADILNATDSELSDFQWMYKKVIEYGVFCFQRKWYRLGGDIQWSAYGVLQVPEEFADFCVSLTSLKIRSAIEIGVYRGRSSYFICAVLMRRNPELRYVLVDIWDGLDAFDRFHSILPALEKKIPSTSRDYKGERFDFVFIDGDHSYDGAMEDFENVGKHSNVITCFHDIYAHEYDGENGGTVRMWKEVMERTTDKHHRIFSNYPDQWMGIGCVMGMNT